MQIYKMNRVTKLLLLLAAVIGLSACQVAGGGVNVQWGEERPVVMHEERMPPAHAPAHGRRAKQRYHYHYYPEASVYFDTGRNVYFYLSGDSWEMSVTLPQRLRLRLGERVSLEMDSEQPYSQYQYHKKKYPPGQLKKGKKKKYKKYKYDD